MEEAMKEHSILKKDDVLNRKLSLYFKFTAHYIVVSSQFMRSDQLSGGVQLDPGRVW